MVYREFELPSAFASIQYHRAPREGSQPISPPSSPVRQVSYPPVEYKKEEPSSEGKKGGRKRVVVEKEKESESDSLSELDEEEEEEEQEEEEEGDGESEREETEEDDEDEGSADEAYTEKGTPVDTGECHSGLLDGEGD